MILFIFPFSDLFDEESPTGCELSSGADRGGGSDAPAHGPMGGRKLLAAPGNQKNLLAAAEAGLAGAVAGAVAGASDTMVRWLRGAVTSGCVRAGRVWSVRVSVCLCLCLCLCVCVLTLGRLG